MGSILQPRVNLALMRLDVAGYECKVLEGMGALGGRALVIKTTLDIALLKGYKCSNSDLIQRLNDLGFKGRKPLLGL